LTRVRRERLRVALSVAGFLGASLTATGRLAAQQSRDSASFVIRGSIRDATTREPVAGVSVSTAEGVTASTDARGEFALERRTAGRVTLRLRRLGYDSLSVEITAPSSGDMRYAFELHRAVQTLDTVAIATRATSWSPKLAGFEQRLARHNGGTFYTQAEIDQRRPVVLSDLVRRSQGVRVVDSMGVRLFASSRGNKISDGPRGRKSVPCVMRVGVDGQVMEWGFAADQVSPSDVFGIEVYSGPATIPREYASQVSDGYCGLVMIWTR
jgi:CarboxypepD_reg-like domain